MICGRKDKLWRVAAIPARKIRAHRFAEKLQAIAPVKYAELFDLRRHPPGIVMEKRW